MTRYELVRPPRSTWNGVTVEELIEILRTQPGDMPVVLDAANYQAVLPEHLDLSEVFERRAIEKLDGVLWRNHTQPELDRITEAVKASWMMKP